ENATTRHSEETRALGARIASLEARMTGLEDRTRPLEVSTDSLEARGEGLRTELQAMQVSVETVGTKASFPLDELTHVEAKIESELTTLVQRLFAVPYMADPEHFVERDQHGRERLGYGSRNGSGSDSFYIGFENVFRGPENLIRDRQRVY